MRMGGGQGGCAGCLVLGCAAGTWVVRGTLSHLSCTQPLVEMALPAVPVFITSWASLWEEAERGEWMFVSFISPWVRQLPAPASTFFYYFDLYYKYT